VAKAFNESEQFQDGLTGRRKPQMPRSLRRNRRTKVAGARSGMHDGRNESVARAELLRVNQKRLAAEDALARTQQQPVETLNDVSRLLDEERRRWYVARRRPRVGTRSRSA
jgi:hypothetical protein